MLDKVEGDWESVKVHERMMPCRERIVEVYKICMSCHVMDTKKLTTSPHLNFFSMTYSNSGVCPYAQSQLFTQANSVID